MHGRSILLLAVLLAGCGAPAHGSASGHGGSSNRASIGKNDAPDSQRRPSADASHATVVAALKAELVGAGTLDGAAITNVTPGSRCSTNFVTIKGATTIDWSKVGNFAGDIEGAKATIPIDDGHGEHRFTLPNGAPFRRVDGAMGLLATDCGGGA